MLQTATPSQQPQSLTAASRLVSGGLSFLLVLAFAFASGVPAGQLMAAVSSGASHHGLERAVAPQTVERQARQVQQERPVALHPLAGALAADSTLEEPAPSAGGRAVGLLLESLLALPPPHATF